MQFERRFTTPGTDIFAQLLYRKASSEIRNPDGTIVFSAQHIEVPEQFSQVATDILAQKYFRKAGVPAALKKVEENEINAYVVQRRSCVSTKDLKQGHIIQEDDIDFLRPCPEGSVQPYEWKEIIGKRVSNDMEKNESFRWTDLS